MRKILLVATAVFFAISCSDDVEIFDENKALIGEFQAKQTFSEDDPNALPVPSYKWIDIEDGYTIELMKDGKFMLTKYTCTTGNYVYDDSLDLLTLNFDCPVEINGENFTTISENLSVNSENGFHFWHEFNRADANMEIASLMLRTE